jgi:hypothetical protein
MTVLPSTQSVLVAKVPSYCERMDRVPYCWHADFRRNFTRSRERLLGAACAIKEVIELSPDQTGQADRRHSDRFPIEREVRFRILSKRKEEDGDGKTVNISSSGVLFTSGQVLLPGRRLELSISWPAQLNNKCALKLVARGRIVRFEDGRAAMEIQQYEFRTQSSGTGSGGPRLVVN